MVIDETIKKQVLTILKEEIIPAEGCTEPIALAYTAAKAVDILQKKPEKLILHVSGNIIKNVKSVVVPNSGGMIGIEIAAAMGALAGDSSKELLVISDIQAKQLEEIKAFVDHGNVEVIHEDTPVKLYCRIEAISGENSVSVEIKHVHTNITKVIRNGITLISRPCSDTDFNSSLTDRKILSIKLIYHLAKTIEIEAISEKFDQVIYFNTAIAEEGLTGNYGINVGKMLQDNMDSGIYGNDQRNRSASFAAAGSDARMSGCSLPVMTTSGSGNQGMTASLPIIKYAIDHNLTKEELYRALFMSHLSTVHIKTNVGRLSAYCGVICASAAVSGGIAFIQGGDYITVSNAITNTLGNVSGIICDGAKGSCASKIATG
ncbi:MAG: serine dehydratase subunit alpha family protein, partial [Flavobacteriales bacterium]